MGKPAGMSTQEWVSKNRRTGDTAQKGWSVPAPNDGTKAENGDSWMLGKPTDMPGSFAKHHKTHEELLKDEGVAKLNHMADDVAKRQAREALREGERQANIKDWMDVVDPSQIKPATPADLELMGAIRNGDVNHATHALGFGADIFREDRIGRTPLLWAAYFGKLAIVNLLIDAGADTSHRDEMWNTASALANSNGHFNVVDRLLKTRVMGIRPTRVCAPSGALLQCRNEHGRLVLPEAFSLGVEYQHISHVIRGQNRFSAADVERQMNMLSQADEDLPSSRR